LNQCKKTKNLIVFAIDVSTIDCLGSLKRAVENKRKFNLRKLSWGENKSNIANPPPPPPPLSPPLFPLL